MESDKTNQGVMVCMIKMFDLLTLNLERFLWCHCGYDVVECVAFPSQQGTNDPSRRDNPLQWAAPNRSWELSPPLRTQG